MRRYLALWMNVVLLALAVQIAAPVATSWAAAALASDPLSAGPICQNGSDGLTQSESDGHRARSGCCTACSPSFSALLPTPDSFRLTVRVGYAVAFAGWREDAIAVRLATAASARGPPLLS